MRTLRLAVLIGAVLCRQAVAGEAEMLRTIAAADASTNMSDLAATVRRAVECCRESSDVSRALTEWLRESHRIHAGRRPTEVAQFRGFLLASLQAFPPSEELYGYVRSELTFAAHAHAIAAAAVTARRFPERAGELVPLMEPFLGELFDDPAVDITTPELTYPLAHPTHARAEILRTIAEFESRGMPSPAAAMPHRLQLLPEQQRRTLSADAMKLQDQDGRALTFGDLHGKPFALAFFYTQCANASKCVSTVRRLRDLAAECAKDRLLDRVGIYGMTYDPRFDSPSVLHKYGRLFGLEFRRNVRLVKTVDDLAPSFREQLQLRVGYGAGTVNQHGIQLFVFDKRGRLAAVHDNDVWSPADVKRGLAQLAAE